jgi:hypothetical protein
LYRTTFFDGLSESYVPKTSRFTFDKMARVGFSLLLLIALLAACSPSPSPTRAERIAAALLHIDDVPTTWLQTSDVVISAKPACEGESYWRTFRPFDEAGRFHRLQQVVLDCRDSASAERAFWGMSRPMVRVVRPPEFFATDEPARADEFVAFCEFNVVGTTDCRVAVRYHNVVSVIWAVRITGMNEWPSNQDMLDWSTARNDAVFARLALKD